MDSTKDLPQEFLARAFCFRDECAWSRSDAIAVIDWLTDHSIAVYGGELWLPSPDGPIVPAPIFYTWASDQLQAELWSAFVARANKDARDYVQQFEWDPTDTLRHKEPFFNLTFADEDARLSQGVRIAASLRLMGPDLDPVEVSALLGVDPTEQHRRGDPHFGKDKRRFADFSEGLWCLTSPIPEDRPLAEHVAWLAAPLTAKKSEIGILKARGLRCDIFVGVFLDGGVGGFVVPNDLLRRMSELGVDLDLDIYAIS